MSKRSDAAADRFFEALLPPKDRPRATAAPTDGASLVLAVQQLCRAAYLLYEAHWTRRYRHGGCSHVDIASWSWPLRELERDHPFEFLSWAEERCPWTVLLREAVRLANTLLNDPNAKEKPK